jgi:hypothetical protein
MYESFSGLEASIESHDVISSLWPFLPSRRDYAY